MDEQNEQTANFSFFLSFFLSFFFLFYDHLKRQEAFTWQSSNG